MRHLLIFLFSLFDINLNSQTVLNFDKHFVECEDKWVAFKPGKDSSYAYGFIYIDAQAGLTLNYEGTFTITATSTFIPKKIDSVNLKMRLEPNNVLVAFIPENKFQELKIDAVPDWLRFYKTDTNSVSRLYHWGFLYNGWNQCAKALTYLERAQKIDPNYKGLAVELAYSYNCLEQYDNAISVLQDVLKSNPEDAYVNKELIYAEILSGQLDKASESCKKVIAICPDKTFNGEICYNLLHEYFIKKDKINFTRWLDETKKWNANNDNILKSIEIMKNQINQ